MVNPWKVLIFITGLVALSGCLVDNQLIIAPSDAAVANPVPASRDFAANNARHKVLLAEIDTGVDYNHPLLGNALHFELDSHGQPTRLGKDYIGNDAWPAPYVVRTSVYDPNLAASDRDASAQNAAALRKILRIAPELGDTLDPRRNVGQEYSEAAYHGTHVAGLMTYDRPDFGLLPYRVLPANRVGDGEADPTGGAVASIISAIDQAAADGARVVNLSLGMDFERAVPGDDEPQAVARTQQMLALQGRLADALNRYPGILFVAAAGNDGSWRDDVNRMGMPCGLRASNLLCVGALRDNGDPAPFTDLPISGADLVFALGNRVLSTLPSRMCADDNLQIAGSLDSTATGDQIAEVARDLKDACLKHPGMGLLSGTSMAAPLVAHLAGEILADHPELDGQGMIREIYRRAMPGFIGTVPVYKLRIVKPSWYLHYAEFDPAAHPAWLGPVSPFGTAEPEYWEGVLAGGAER